MGSEQPPAHASSVHRSAVSTLLDDGAGSHGVAAQRRIWRGQVPSLMSTSSILRIGSGSPRMKAVRWEDTKRQVRELNPDWDTPERVASRERSRAAMRAEQRGYQLAQLRKNTGLTQAQVAAVMGVSQARVSQIEHGKVTEVDAIRSYVEALGGTVDVVARVGDWTVRVA
jgi:DNA-binding XRE family transcriptional regulator